MCDESGAALQELALGTPLARVTTAWFKKGAFYSGNTYNAVDCGG